MGQGIDEEWDWYVEPTPCDICGTEERRVMKSLHCAGMMLNMCLKCKAVHGAGSSRKKR